MCYVNTCFFGTGTICISFRVLYISIFDWTQTEIRYSEICTVLRQPVVIQTVLEVVQTRSGVSWTLIIMCGWI